MCECQTPPLCHLTFRCASHSCIVADLLGGKPLSSLYCVRHAGLGPKRDTAKHASTQHSEQEETWRRRLMDTDRGRVNRNEWQARQRLCKTNRNDGPNTDLLANTGSAWLAKHQQGEWQNFHSEQSSNSRPKARPGLGKRRRRPAQWAAAAESTAACSMADPGSRMTMDPLLCSIALWWLHNAGA